MKVVFDTNVFGAIASPADYVNFDENVCAKLREAILAGKVQPFISVAPLVLNPWATPNASMSFSGNGQQNHRELLSQVQAKRE